MIPHTPPAPATLAPKPAERITDSSTLFGPHNEIFIRHGQDIYTLRRTRNGKLILTK